MKKLSERERAFVEAFLGKAKGNATRAAQLAGYGGNLKSAATLGWRLLRKVEIQRAIHGRVARREMAADFGAAERDKMAHRIAHVNEERNPKTSLRAIDMLNKCEGRYSSTLNHRFDEKTVEALVMGSHGKA